MAHVTKNEEKTSAFWKKMRTEFKKKYCETTEATAMDVVLAECGDGKYVGLDIYPAKTNTSGSFYHAEELVEFCDYHGLSEWISTCTRNGAVCVHVHIY